MKLSDYQYTFPDSSIAVNPPKVRGTSKLFVVHSQTGEITIAQYKDLYKYLNEGDLVVRNTTKVVKSRLLPTHVKMGALTQETNVEIFILSSEDYKYDEYIASAFDKRKGAFELKALVRLKRNKVSRIDEFVFHSGWRMKIGDELDDSYTVLLWKDNWRSPISIESAVSEFKAFLESEGHVPIPPYLKRDDTEKDKERYQTVFAKFDGSVAAPTASLNFTEKLEDQLIKQKSELADIVLHVGLGTFASLRYENIAENKLHNEAYYVSPETLEQLRRAKSRFKRVLAVGTTALRTLETIADNLDKNEPISGNTNLFVYPPYQFKLVNTLLTNFHYPSTSLIVLVDAFLQYKQSKVNWKQIYEFAIDNGAKLFSYGDSMLIL